MPILRFDLASRIGVLCLPLSLYHRRRAFALGCCACLYHRRRALLPDRELWYVYLPVFASFRCALPWLFPLVYFRFTIVSLSVCVCVCVYLSVACGPCSFWHRPLQTASQDGIFCPICCK